MGSAKTADRNLNDTAYQTIKDDIISCALQPGEEISEAVLVARYRMSKAPIRSALMRLRQEGLIISRGRQGNIVSTVTLRDVQEIFQLRLVLETVVTRMAAGKVDPQRIRALNKAVHAGFSPGDKAGEAAYLGVAAQRLGVAGLLVAAVAVVAVVGDGVDAELRRHRQCLVGAGVVDQQQVVDDVSRDLADGPFEGPGGVVGRQHDADPLAVDHQ